MDRAVSSGAGDRVRWILFVLCAAEFLVGIDTAIVAVAVPAIQHGLGFSHEGAQWVMTGLLLPFGGLLLVAGRAADLVGRKKILIAGLVLFTAASLAAGVATTPAMLIAMRALQGIASAMIAPAALSLITTLFPEGPERDRALGIAGSVLPLGFVVGLIASGVLTSLSWRLTLLVNVPMGLLVLALALPLITENRDRGAVSQPISTATLDLPGALSGTATLFMLLFGITQAETVGWTSVPTLVTLALSVLLGAAFVMLERRAPAPLAPLWVLTRRSVWVSALPGLATFAGAVGVIFTLTFYTQQAWNYTPLQAGLAFVPMGMASILAGRTTPRLLSRVSARCTLFGGLLIQAAGTAVLVLLAFHPATLGVFLLGTGVAGFGHITSVVAFRSTIASGLPDTEQGLIAGLANVIQQVGAAFGVALLTAITVARSDALQHTSATDTQALTAGTHAAVTTVASLLAVAAFVALVGLSRGRDTQPTTEAPAPTSG